MKPQEGLTLFVSVLVALALASPAQARIRTIEPGVKIATAATVPNPTNVAFAADRSLWITSGIGAPAATDGVYRVARAAKSRRARRIVRTQGTALGVAWLKNRMYVSTIASPSCGRIAVYSGFTGRRFRAARILQRCLPIGRHAVNTLAAGPDGRLYAGIGSRADTRAGGGLSSTVVSMRPSGRGLRVEARGLRNPFGLAFVPSSRTLLVTENGRDDLGLGRPPEELNAFDVRRRTPSFGFPFELPSARDPLVELPPHAAPGGVGVARNWRGQGLTAFVVQFGSSFANRTGSDVWRVRLKRTSAGAGVRATQARQWATGFPRNGPLGATVGPDGALYVTLLTSGRVVSFR